MNVIPRRSSPSSWGREIARKREQYRRLKAEHRVDISKVRAVYTISGFGPQIVQQSSCEELSLYFFIESTPA